MTTITAEEAGAAVSASPPREDLIRALHSDEAVTLTRSEDGAMPTLTGHFAVFNEWTEINSVFEGHFLERFAASSMDKTLAEGRDRMRVLFQHGQDPQIGDKVLGPIARLEPDKTGAFYEVPMLDTSYNRDLIPGLDAGLYGASFRFQVLSEEFVKKPARSEYNPEGLPERTVTEARVREFGPVTFPAYAGATAGLRSLTDEFLFGKFVDDPERFSEMLAAFKDRKIVEPEPSAATTPANTSPDIEPEPSEATTRPRASRPAGLYPNREEKPAWLL